ncbi:MAG: hypothetical protein ABL967_19020 [Bryobacteraceae bacterium]
MSEIPGNEKERLLNCLFGDSKVITRDIKFMRGDKQDVTEDEFCREINSALLQRKTGLRPRPTEDAETIIDIKELVGGL